MPGRLLDHCTFVTLAKMSTGQTQLRKIISGGQTGVDRAALNVAMALGIEHGGWCPLGRLAEDGFIPTRYALRQTETAKYAERTERNLLAADGTLILYRHELSGGTELTHWLCRRHARPFCLVNLSGDCHAEQTAAWLCEQKIAILNVAGPRESTSPGISAEAEQFLQAVLGIVTSAAPPAISG